MGEVWIEAQARLPEYTKIRARDWLTPLVVPSQHVSLRKFETFIRGNGSMEDF